VYSNGSNYIIDKYEEVNNSVAEDLQIPIKYVDDTIIESIDSIDVLKVLLVCDNHDEVKSLEVNFSKFKDLTVVSSANRLLDIMASNISKGNALKILSDKLRVNLNEVIAFGDNYNDIEMLKCAGMSVAMGNAVQEVKKIAKYITKSNDEDGIAYAINNI
jgi:Cof subfamily protein (haloacid dehalogenase superfamily)